MTPSRVVRTYRAASRRRAQARRLADAVFDGVFLGLMDRAALAALDEWFYETVREDVGGVARRYDEPEHVHSGLREWERTAVREAFAPRGRIVVTAAGAGREVLALLDAGFDAVGYEPHERLLAAGRTLLGDRLRPAERDAFPAAAGAADGVLVGWGSYMLIPGRARRVAFLRAARATLAAGAGLVLSFFVRPPGPYLHVLRAAAAPLRRAGGREPVELGDALSPNFVHLFTRAEIEAELAEAGFACTAYRDRPYGHALARAV